MRRPTDKSAALLALILGAGGAMFGHSDPPAPRYPVKLTPGRIPGIEPEWAPALIPKGHTKETISATFTKDGKEMSVSGDIAYTNLKRREQRMTKLLKQIQRWYTLTPTDVLLMHPRVSVAAPVKTKKK